MLRIFLMLAACLLCFATRAQDVAAASPAIVAVRLASGRTFMGHVDPRSDDRQLWIRSVYGRAVVLRPVMWESIQSVHVDGQTQTAEEFRRLAPELKNNTPQRIWPEGSANSLDLLSRSAWTSPACLPIVRSLQATIHPSNWDDDADPDGFELTIAPLDEFGALLPVEGTIEATLFGYDHRNGLPLEHWSQLARWSRSVTLGCYAPAGGLLRLGFDAVPADLDRFHSPRRMLRVRLTAPGHGTFVAEVPLIAAETHWPRP